MAEHRFRKAGVEGSNPSIGFVKSAKKLKTTSPSSLVYVGPFPCLPFDRPYRSGCHGSEITKTTPDQETASGQFPASDSFLGPGLGAGQGRPSKYRSQRCRSGKLFPPKAVSIQMEQQSGIISRRSQSNFANAHS